MKNIFKSLGEDIRRLPRRVWETVVRFPGSALCVLGVFIFVELMEHFDMDYLDKAVFVLALAFVLSAAAELFLESYEAKTPLVRAICYAVIYLILQAYYLVFDLDGQRGMVEAAFIAAAVCALALISMNVRTQNDFEKNVARILARMFSSALFSLVLFLGLLAILGGVNILLTDVDSEFFIEAAQISFIIFMPIMFLMGLPRQEDGREYPAPLANLLTYVVIPLTLVFTAVLYVYYIKLAITRSLPISEAGGVSLAFLGVCVPALVLVKELKNKLCVWAGRVLPYLLIPVVAVLFLAAGTRIAQYGITITRYLVSAGGLAACFAIALFIFRGGARQRFICYVVAAVALILAIGPASAYNMTLKSQNKRFVALLEKNDMLAGGKIVPNPDAAEADKKEIAAIVRYFDREDMGEPEYYPKDGDMQSVLGFVYKNTAAAKEHTYYHLDERGAIALEDYDYYIGHFNLYGEKIFTHSAQSVRVGCDGQDDSQRIVIKSGEDELISVPVRELIAQLRARLGDGREQGLSAEELTCVRENEKIRVRFIAQSVDFAAENSDLRSGYSEWSLLIKFK